MIKLSIKSLHYSLMHAYRCKIATFYVVDLQQSCLTFQKFSRLLDDNEMLSKTTKLGGQIDL